jgi:DNA uptake protein ComE-like DNA-binding protein
MRAEALIEHRERYGAFAGIEDIRDVRDMGPEICVQLQGRIGV